MYIEDLVQAYIYKAFEDYLKWSLDGKHKRELELLKKDILEGNFLTLTPFCGRIEPREILTSWEWDVQKVRKDPSLKRDILAQHRGTYKE